ncbi:MAG: AAA family ATPase, partial [Acidobacteriota bacterium]
MNALSTRRGLAPVDRHFARLIGRLARQAGEDAALLEETAAWVSRERGRGHSCLLLEKAAGQPKLGGDESGPGRTPSKDRSRKVEHLPSLEAWRETLRGSSLVALPDDASGPGAAVAKNLTSKPLTPKLLTPKPLVLDASDRLYLWRYWRAEQKLAARLLAMAPTGDGEAGLAASVAALWRRLFPDAAGAEIDSQAAAAAAALTSPLSLVSGGPGTGKTTTVVRLLAVAAEAWPDLRIQLAAPTGKAAARLDEAIRGQLEKMDEDLRLKVEALPRKAATLHRTLGYSPRTDRFRHHAGRPLTCDLLVIDEASMVDLLMMHAALDALPAGSRLVLLGDRDQLASVETGFVFGDLCAAAGLERPEAESPEPPEARRRLPARLQRAYDLLAGIPTDLETEESG